MNRRGFTLVELLVVIFVIALLTGLMFGAYWVISVAKIKDTQGRVHTIGNEVETRARLEGSYPASLSDLLPRFDQPKWLLGGRFVDAFDQPLRYEVQSRTFRLWSVGPDGADGTADDIEYRK